MSPESRITPGDGERWPAPNMKTEQDEPDELSELAKLGLANLTTNYENMSLRQVMDQVDINMERLEERRKEQYERGERRGFISRDL